MSTLIKADQKHIAFMNALRGAQRQHTAKLTTEEMLMIAAQFVGGMIALMPVGSDVIKVTEQVGENIAHGNKQMILALLAAPDTSEGKPN